MARRVNPGEGGKPMDRLTVGGRQRLTNGLHLGSGRSLNGVTVVGRELDHVQVEGEVLFAQGIPDELPIKES